jgi:hypothetical protein
VNLFPSTLRSSLRPFPFKRSYQAHDYFSFDPVFATRPSHFIHLELHTLPTLSKE